MPRYYAGVGSRQTPGPIMYQMKSIARVLQDKGFILRSGGAPGADTAFAQGCTDQEIYVPWNNFQGLPMEYPIPEEAFEIAELCHPGWNSLSLSVRTLMARNTMQVLGADLNTPSEFVLCWTPDGTTRAEDTTKVTGGTGQAIRVACMFAVPVFNLCRPEHNKRFRDMVYYHKENG